MIYFLFFSAIISLILLYGFLHNEVEQEEETHKPDTSITKRIKEKYEKYN